MKNSNRMSAVAMAAMVAAVMAVSGVPSARAELVPVGDSHGIAKKRNTYFAGAAEVSRKRDIYFAGAAEVARKRDTYFAGASELIIRQRNVWFAKVSNLLRGQ